jgi:hypothetical protein
MDLLLQGRTGQEATGGLIDRVERTLRSDFAYGGIGMDLAQHARPASLDTAADYLVRLVTLPIPRVLWTGKPILDPNWEMTETYTGVPLSVVASITLFTPLGEALFYFGCLGLLIIPIMYGFTVRLLERVYSSSLICRGLLAQVIVWAFIGMRHTYWNLYSALILVNLLAILFLLVVKWLAVNRKAQSEREQPPAIRVPRRRPRRIVIR